MYSQERKGAPKIWACRQLWTVKTPSQEQIGQAPMSIPQDKEMAYDKLRYSLKLPQLYTLDKKNSNPIEIFKKWHWPSLTVPYSTIKL